MKTINTLLICLLTFFMNNVLANEKDTAEVHFLTKRGGLKPVDHANIYTYKHVLKFSVGMSRELNQMNRFLLLFDQERVYSLEQFSPVFSFAHEFYLDEIFSLKYSLGYSHSELKRNSDPIQNHQANLFIHPKLNYFRRSRFEAYTQLNIGVMYNDLNKEKIENEALRRNLPSNWKMFTGFTPVGFNFRITDQLWFNTEVSLWSYESISCGLKLKLGENLNHPKNWVGMD